MLQGDGFPFLGWRDGPLCSDGATSAVLVDGVLGDADRPGDTFRGWLRGITRNQVLLYFRRNQGRPQAEGGSEALGRLQEVTDALAGSPEDEAAEVSQLYRRAVARVKNEFEERTWQMFWLTVIEGRSPAALAEEVGVTPAAVRQAKSRVLRRLRQEMGELLD